MDGLKPCPKVLDFQLARTLPGILPKMSIDESLDVTRIYSVAKQFPIELLYDRPYPGHRPAAGLSKNQCRIHSRVHEIFVLQLIRALIHD